MKINVKITKIKQIYGFQEVFNCKNLSYFHISDKVIDLYLKTTKLKQPWKYRAHSNLRSPNQATMYGIMTEERFIREIRIDEAAGRDDSDSRMTCFEVIMPLKLQSTKLYIVFETK